MRKSTVRTGLRLILAGIVTVILATFYHGTLAALVSLTAAEEARLVFLGLFWGGALGGAGIIVAAYGLLRSGMLGSEVRLLPIMIVLAAAMLLFFLLLYSSLRETPPPRLRPGETITIQNGRVPFPAFSPFPLQIP